MKRLLLIPGLLFAFANVEAQDASFTSNTSLVIIDANVRSKDGKVIAWYPDNDWKPEDVVATIRKNVS